MGRYRGKPSNRNGSKGKSKTDSQNTSSEKKKKKKELIDYEFQVGNSRQANEYQKTADFLINHIKTTYEFGDDIGEALRTGEEALFEFDEPVFQESEADNAAKKIIEDQINMVRYKKRFADWEDRVKTYGRNKNKASTFLWEKCSVKMREALTEKVQFEDEYQTDPIKLLKQIKKHALAFQQSTYRMAAIVDAQNGVNNLKQKNDESLMECGGELASKNVLYLIPNISIGIERPFFFDRDTNL